MTWGFLAMTHHQTGDDEEALFMYRRFRSNNETYRHRFTREEVEWAGRLQAEARALLGLD